MKLLIETSHDNYYGEILRDNIPENKCSFTDIRNIIEKYCKKQGVRVIHVDCKLLDRTYIPHYVYNVYDAYVVDDKRNKYTHKNFRLENIFRS